MLLPGMAHRELLHGPARELLPAIKQGDIRRYTLLLRGTNKLSPEPTGTCKGSGLEPDLAQPGDPASLQACSGASGCSCA